MKLAIGSELDWRGWVVTDELTAEEVAILLQRAGGWVIIDMEKDLIYDYVYQKWEPVLNKATLVQRIKDDLEFYRRG